MALTGVDSLDEFLGGGFLRGDNVVWITPGSDEVNPFVEAFLAGGADRTVVRRHLDVTGGSGEECSAQHIAPDLARTSPTDLEALLLSDDVGTGARLAVTGLDQMLTEWGSDETLRFYTRTCPRLFDRGAIAYWTGSRDVLGTGLIDGVTRVAQCVFELRPGRLRVVKAEGRPPRLQGAIVEIDVEAEQPVIRREHASGRVAEGLRRIRKERNLSQTQIAALAGVTPAAISQAESGRRGLSLDTILPLCETLGIGVDEFLGTKLRSDPYIARHDHQAPSQQTTALFDDPALGPAAHLVRLSPDETGRPPFIHKGPELIFVASGLILVDLGDTTPVLRAGDALMAVRTPVRRWTNLDPSEAQLFWVAVTTAGATEA